MKLKSGVSVLGASPELVIGLIVADTVYRSHALDLVVTALTDGRHKDGSLHYRGAAADLRLPSRLGGTLDDDHNLVRELAAALGPEWDIVLENDHIHLELDAYKRRSIA